MPAAASLMFRLASPADVPALRVLYNEIIEAMDASRWHAQWRKNGYPTDADLKQAAESATLHLACLGQEIVGATVLNHHFNPGYHAVPWQVQCAPQQVLCIHTLGVSPRFQRCGVASALVQHAAAVARTLGCKCLRLDVIENNHPADLLYTRLGFSFREARRLHYGSVSAVFNMYELVLA